MLTMCQHIKSYLGLDVLQIQNGGKVSSWSLAVGIRGKILSLSRWGPDWRLLYRTVCSMKEANRKIPSPLKGVVSSAYSFFY